MENLFRLEFNEKQQMFHHAHQNDVVEPNTFGWHTIAENCSYDENLIFKAFLYRKKKKKLTLDYVLTSFSELQSFWSNLSKYEMTIKKA